MSPSFPESLHVQEMVLLAPLTSFGLGGPARFFVETADADQVIAAVRWARDEGIPLCILGGGTNVLVSDRGFDGLVIHMAGSDVIQSGTRITAEAGASLMSLVEKAASEGLAGMEALAGIPGTVGGAVRGNAGAFGADIGEYVEEVRVLHRHTLELDTFPRDRCGFGYRSSMFRQRADLIIVSVGLTVPEGDGDAVRARMAEILAKRGRWLHGEKSAGSFFLNPDVVSPELVSAFESAQGITCRNCRVPAGWLIDRAGLRGKKLGGAMVNELHANYLINTGNASAAEVRELAELVKREVRERLGVELKEEVAYVGFDS